MPRTFNRFLEINDAAKSGAPSPIATASLTSTGTTNQPNSGGDNLTLLDKANLINFSDDFDAAGQSAANARSNRAAALKQLTIQRKKLEFQRRTGLRDIGQARTKGLKGAINNALQRGIFRSGILTENKAEVNRESDEAQSDLKSEIQFALDDLAARRQGLASQKFGSGSGRTGGLTEAEAVELANDQATLDINKPPVIPAGPGSNINLRQGRNTLPGPTPLLPGSPS